MRRRSGAVKTYQLILLRQLHMPIDFPALFAVLNAAQTRYVLVGGLAVVLHGFERVTSHADIILDLAPDSARNAINALVQAGYRSLTPVDPVLFADPAIRNQWMTDKGLAVFSLWDTTQRRPNINLFVSHPIPFEELYADSVPTQLLGSHVRLASLQHLIHLKKLSGRPRDLDDIRMIESRLAKDRT